MFIFERESECELAGEGQRETETQNPTRLQSPSFPHSAQGGAWTQAVRITTWAKVPRLTNWDIQLPQKNFKVYSFWERERGREREIAWAGEGQRERERERERLKIPTRVCAVLGRVGELSFPNGDVMTWAQIKSHLRSSNSLSHSGAPGNAFDAAFDCRILTIFNKKK